MGLGLAEERVPLGRSAAATVDVELQQRAQGTVNRVDLGHIDGIAQRRDAVDVLLGQRQGSAIGEAVPLAAIKTRVGVGRAMHSGLRRPVRRGVRRGRRGDVRGALGDAHDPIVPHKLMLARTQFAA